MTLKESLDFLSNGGYVVYVKGSPVFTSKLYQELGVVKLESAPTAAPEPILKDLTLSQKRDLWHDFVNGADLPWRVTTNGKTYTVCQFNLVAVHKLMKILSDPAIDKTVFQESVKHYYRTVDFKTTFHNYLISDMWKFEYERFKKGTNTVTRNDGSNKFED